MRCRCLLSGLLPLLLLLHLASALFSDELAREPQPDWWQKDASLKDVFFLDARLGWAVGSHGTLLRTIDGGITWIDGSAGVDDTQNAAAQVPLSEKIQRSNNREWVHRPEPKTERQAFSTSFESVCFADQNRGWAVGGSQIPGLNHSRAMVVTTRDGGQTWQPLGNQLVPRLKVVSFPNPANMRNGWAVGEVDPATGASVFFTTSGGSVWAAQKTQHMPAIKRAASVGNRFVVVDQQGQLGIVANNRFEYAVVSTRFAPVINDLVMTNPKEGWAVGSNGAVVKTRDGGITWKPAAWARHIPVSHCEFRTLCRNQNDIWVGGTAGRFLFRIDAETDIATKVELPEAATVNRIRFADSQNGWAVGDYGMIFATRDGGQNWKLQRRGAGKATAQVESLIFCESSEKLPLEFLARACVEKGKRVAVRVFVQPNEETNFDAVRFACERLGARSVEPIVVSPDRPEKENFLIGTIVQQIRHLRPSLVVSAGGDLAPVVGHAIEAASQAKAFEPQLQLGLSPWQSRWFTELTLSPNATTGSDRFLPQVGMHLSDVLLVSTMATAKDSGLQRAMSWSERNFSLKFGRGLEQQFINESPLDEIESARGFSRSIAASNLSQIRSMAQKRTTIDRLVKLVELSPRDAGAFQNELRHFAFSLTSDPVSQRAAGLWMLQLSDRLMQSGYPQQAVDCLEMLVQTFPGHSLTEVASTRLAKHFASEEWALIASKYPQATSASQGVATAQRIATTAAPQSHVQQASVGEGRTEYRWTKPDVQRQLDDAAEVPISNRVNPETTPEPPSQFDPNTVDLTVDISPEALAANADAIATIDTALEGSPTPPIEHPTVDMKILRNGRFLKAARYFSRIGQKNPGLVQRNDFRFIQAHIVRQIGKTQPESGSNPGHYFELIHKQGTPRDAFGVAAAVESELIANSFSEELQNVAPRTSERPLLDGLAKENIWQGGQSLRGGNVRFAYDDQHLYLFVECSLLKPRASQQPPGKRSREIRQRDAKLDNDFVTISLDCDRDLSSAWHIRVDQTGQIQESCDFLLAWNPKIFAAHHVSEKSWSVEMAIPLSELGDLETLMPLKPWWVTAHRSLNGAVATVPEDTRVLVFR